MKILLQILLMLMVNVYISFANQVVTLEIDKANIEGVSKIELYQNSDTIPFTTLDPALPRPWIISADLVSINGVMSLSAIPVDINGVKGSRSPDVVYKTLDGSDITIKITGQ